jgi:hypothetical protein
LSGLPALATTVSATQGQVLISRGQGYQQVTGSTQANPGDTVVANPGGSGQIVYPDGCTVQVRPGSIVAVAPQSPCNQQEAPASATSNTLIVGAVVVIGTLAGVGIAALIIGLKDKPASP